MIGESAWAEKWAASWQNQQNGCTPSEDSEADLSLRWAHTHFVGFVARRLKSIFANKNLVEEHQNTGFVTLVNECKMA